MTLILVSNKMYKYEVPEPLTSFHSSIQVCWPPFSTLGISLNSPRMIEAKKIVNTKGNPSSRYCMLGTSILWSLTVRCPWWRISYELKNQGRSKFREFKKINVGISLTREALVPKNFEGPSCECINYKDFNLSYIYEESNNETHSLLFIRKWIT